MSDAQLEMMTKMVNSNNVVGIKEVKPTYETSTSFVIELNNGRTLNEFLPKEIKFLIDKKDPAAYSPLRKAIYFNPELLNNPNYRAVLAHECGHALVNNAKKEHLTYLQTGHEILYTDIFRNLPLEDRLKKIYSLMQLELDNEIDATDRGKIVADLLGVDSVAYEDMTTISLQNHFWASIFHTEKFFEETRLNLKNDTLIPYYNPFTREASQVTYREFKTLGIKAKDEHARIMGVMRNRVNLP